MTQHSDYFVWKDMSERVARRFDDTVDKKKVNSCVLQHIFLEGVEQESWATNKIAKKYSLVTIWKFSRKILRLRLFWLKGQPQNFAADAA